MIRARGFDMKGAVDYVIPNSLQEMNGHAMQSYSPDVEESTIRGEN